MGSMQSSQQRLSAPLPQDAADKAAQRRHFQSLRDSFGREDLAQANAAIRSHIATLLTNMQAKSVAAYMASSDEPGGDGLSDWLLTRGCQVWLPVSLPKGVLHWGQYLGPDSLTGSRFGIPEPAEPHFPSSILADLDLILVPALAANAAGVRLGKGAGYYDRGLQHCDTPTALLLFNHEIEQPIAVQDHDVACDWVISPHGIKANP